MPISLRFSTDGTHSEEKHPQSLKRSMQH